MATETKTNAEDTTCRDCETALATGEGIKEDYYSDRFICAACNGKRIELREQQRQLQIAQGAVLLGILPAIERIGAVTKVASGAGQYVAEATVLIKGTLYEISVRAIERN